MFDAAEQFKKRASSLREVTMLDASYDNELGITKPEFLSLVESLRQSLAILPVAFFEDFLRTIVEQFADRLNSITPRVKWTDLPLPLRKAHIFDTPLSIRKKPSDGDDDSYQMKCLLDINEILSKIISPITTPDSYTIVIDSLTNTNSNPDSETVKEMLKRIGITNVFQDTEFVNEWKAFDRIYDSGENIKRKLNEIVQLRHSVAHGRAAAGLSRSDLELNISFLEYLTATLQNVILRNYGKITTN
jgi:hypothetical protein